MGRKVFSALALVVVIEKVKAGSKTDFGIALEPARNNK